MRAWTDYPIEELGDILGAEAPIRECEVLGWDGDKYATVVVCGIRTSFKAGYIYTKPGRCGNVQGINRNTLPIIESE
jgi:hypothetical protein